MVVLNIRKYFREHLFYYFLYANSNILFDINYNKLKKMKTLTMQELEDIGFEVTKCYPHDNFITQRRQKGGIQIETTWDKDNNHLSESQDIMIDETYIEKFSKVDLLILDKIINR